VAGPDGEPLRYRLRPAAFYLPYLVLQGAARAPLRTTAPGYRDLPTLALAPEEAAVLRRAAERVIALQEPALVADARGALRKLRYDLPDLRAEVREPAPAREPGAFAALVDAVERGKRVTFAYHSMARDATASRTVEPYGLVFVTGQWYLVARDVAADGIRRFRLTRMRGVRVNPRTPATRDFTTPADLDLKAHARSRQAWALGAGDEEAIIVRFDGAGGDVSAARTLGEPAGEHAAHRRFAVRRRDVFLRWLLSFAGDAVPVAPPSVVRDWQALVGATAAAHRAAAGDA
jgi:proteasome accessory factor B